MAEGIIFVAECPDVALDANGATLSYMSGDVRYIRRYPRVLWRAFVEREMARLNDWEAAEIHRVVDFRLHGH